MAISSRRYRTFFSTVRAFHQPSVSFKTVVKSEEGGGTPRNLATCKTFTRAIPTCPRGIALNFGTRNGFSELRLRLTWRFILVHFIKLLSKDSIPDRPDKKKLISLHNNVIHFNPPIVNQCQSTFRSVGFSLIQQVHFSFFQIFLHSSLSLLLKKNHHL